MKNLFKQKIFYDNILGTDDDFPPPHQNKFRSGGPGGSSGNGRTMAVGPGPPRIQNDMETQIHLIEQEAYTSVLRAFKAQSDAITWVSGNPCFISFS